MNWQKRSRKAALSLDERFWEKVTKRGPDECWEWQAGRTVKGYGQIRPGAPSRQYALAHRVSYELHNGPIPEGLWVCHRCDNPPCVNPAHLFLGTEEENRQDMYAKARASGNSAKGSANAYAKLDEAKVAEIRLRLERGEKPGVIAAAFGVTNTTVYDIRSGKRWSHVGAA